MEGWIKTSSVGRPIKQRPAGGTGPLGIGKVARLLRLKCNILGSIDQEKVRFKANIVLCVDEKVFRQQIFSIKCESKEL